MSHKTFTTAAELAAQHELTGCISSTNNPQQWTIFCHSRLALQAHQMLKGSSYYAFCRLISIVTKMGHEIVFQWIPSYRGIMGSEAPDYIVKMANTSAQHLAVPYVASSFERLGSHSPWLYGTSQPTTISACMCWMHSLHPDLLLTFPCEGKQSFIACVLAFHLLDTTFLKLRKFHPSTAQFGERTRQQHIRNSRSGKKYQQNFDSSHLAITKVLATWSAPQKTCAAIRGLVNFLVNSGLSCKLGVAKFVKCTIFVCMWCQGIFGKKCLLAFSFFFLEWPSVHVVTYSKTLSDTRSTYVRKSTL